MRILCKNKLTKKHFKKCT